MSDLLGPAEREALHQRILNGRPIPDRRRQRLDRVPIPVLVRLVWERDGEEQVETVACDWVDRDVLVDVHDIRWPVLGVWVEAGDVRRL